MTRPPKRISSRVVVGMVAFGPFWVWVILYRVGIFAAAKMAHLSDDEPVARIGHSALVRSDVGPSRVCEDRCRRCLMNYVDQEIVVQGAEDESPGVGVAFGGKLVRQIERT